MKMISRFTIYTLMAMFCVASWLGFITFLQYITG